MTEGGDQGSIPTAGWLAEVGLLTDRVQKAALLYEIGHRAEVLSGDTEEASVRYHDALKIHVGFRPALYALLRILASKRDSRGLAELLTTTTRQLPNSHERTSLSIELANLLEDRLGEPKKAKALLVRALDQEASPEAALMVEYFASVHRDPALRAKAIQVRSERATDPLLRRLLVVEAAELMVSENRVDDAIERLRAAASTPLERWRVLAALAEIGRCHDRPEVVIEALEKMASSLEGVAPAGKSSTGSVFAGTLPAFASDARARARAAALWWDSSRLRLSRASDAQGAAEALDRACQLAPRDPFLRWARAEVLEADGDTRGAADEVLELIRLIKEPAASASLRVWGAELLLAADDNKAALGLLTEAVKLEPVPMVAAGQLANVFWRLGAPERLVATLERWTNHLKGDVKARVLFEAADVAATSGDFVRARGLFQRSSQSATDASGPLREFFGYAMLMDPSRAPGVALELAAATTDRDEKAALLHLAHRTTASSSDESHSDAAQPGWKQATDDLPGWFHHADYLVAIESEDRPSWIAAHRSLARSLESSDARLAHRAAAVRQLMVSGAREEASRCAAEMLASAPDHPFARAFLEELFRQDGRAEELVELLAGVADSDASPRTKEVTLLLAAEVAGTTNQKSRVAPLIRQAVTLSPGSVGARARLREIAVESADEELLGESLVSLSELEREGGGAGRYTLELGEYLDLALSDPGGWAHTAAVLDHPVYGASAAANLAMVAEAAALPAGVITRLLESGTSPPAGLRAAVCGLLLAHPGASEGRSLPLSETVRSLGEHHPRDCAGRLFGLFLLERRVADSASRAEALSNLAQSVGDERLTSELHLATHWTRLVRRGDDVQAPSVEVGLFPFGPSLALASDETWGPLAPLEEAEGLRRRLGVAEPHVRHRLDLLRADALVRAGRTAEALTVLKELGQGSSDSASSNSTSSCVVARHLLVLACTGDTDELEPRLESASALASALKDDAKASANLLEEAARVSALLGRTGETETFVRQILALDPSRVVSLEQFGEVPGTSDPSTLIAILAARVPHTDDPTELASLYSRKAKAHLDVDDAEGAVETLAELRILEPGHAFGTALHVVALSKLGKFAESIDLLRELSCLDVSDQVRRSARSLAARFMSEELEDPAGALSELEAVERMGFVDGRLVARMAHLAERAGNLDVAVSNLARAAQASEGPERARYEKRAGMLYQVSLTDSRGAIDAYRRALEAAPTDLEAASALSRLLDRGARHRLAVSFQKSVFEALAADPADMDLLRSLRSSALWGDDPDLEWLALSVLGALDGFRPEEQLRFEALSRDHSWEADGTLPKDAMARLLGPKRDGAEVELLRSLEGDVFKFDGRTAKQRKLGRRDAIATDDASFEKAERVQKLFGLSLSKAYRGDGGGALADGVVVIDESDDPGDATFDLCVGSFAAATGLGALVGRDVTGVSDLLATAAAVCGESWDQSPSETDSVLLLRKALGRSTKKAIVPLLRTVSPSTVLEVVPQLRFGLVRGAVLGSSDLARGIEFLGDWSAGVRGLLLFWLSTEHRELRRDLGVGVTGTEFASAQATGQQESGAALDAKELERASQFFRQVDEPIEWSVTAEDVVESLTPERASIREVGGAASTHFQKLILNTRELARSLLATCKVSDQVMLNLLLSNWDRAAGNQQAAWASSERACSADPDDPIALRRHRRFLFQRGAWADAVRTIDTETKLPLSPAERSGLLILAASVQLHRLGDAAAAERSLTSAVECDPKSPGAALLLAELQFSQRKLEEAGTSLERAARLVSDNKAHVALLCLSAYLRSAAGDSDRARYLFRRASDLDASSIQAAFGLARIAGQTRAFDDALDALTRLAILVPDRELGEAFLRLAAKLSHLAARRPEHALTLVSGATGLPALEAAAGAAAAAGKGRSEAEVLRSAAALTERTARAIMLCRVARLKILEGSLKEADEAIREASHADQTLTLLPLATEALARKAGDAAAITRSAVGIGYGPTGACARAAVLGEPKGPRGQLERRFIANREASVGRDRVLLSLWAVELSKPGTRSQALSSYVACLTPTDRFGPMLASAVAAEREGDHSRVRQLLEEIHTLDDQNLAAKRWLAEVTAPTDPARAAEIWLSESDSSDGPRAGFAALMAARLLEQSGRSPLKAIRRAITLDYGPAFWALERVLRGGANPDLTNLLREDVAVRPAGEERNRLDAVLAASRLIRIGLASENTDLRAKFFARALELVPYDEGLRALKLREAERDPRLRAELTRDERMFLLGGSDDAPPGDAPWHRVQRLRRAVAYEVMGEDAKAINECDLILAGDPEAPVAGHLVSRLEKSADRPDTDAARARREARVARATNDLARAIALIELADFEAGPGDNPHAAILALRGVLALYPSHVASLRALERLLFLHGEPDLVREVEEQLARLGSADDTVAHTRLTVRLLRNLSFAESEANEQDSTISVLEHAFDHARADTWLCRQLEMVARETGNDRLLLQAFSELAEQMDDTYDRAAFELRAAEATVHTKGPSVAANRLARLPESTAAYPVLVEMTARFREGAGGARKAAEGYLHAARLAKSKPRRAQLYLDAARVFREQAANHEGARDALLSAMEAEPALPEFAATLKMVMPECSEAQARRLLAVLALRGRVVTGKADQVETLRAEATLQERLKEVSACKKALNRALSLAPDDFDIVRELYRVCEVDADWTGAAAALTRGLGMTSDPAVQRSIHLRLADVHERKRDIRRAAVALEAAIELAPDPNLSARLQALTGR